MSWICWRFGWIGRRVTEVEVASHAATRFGKAEVGGIRMDVEYHVAGHKFYYGIRVGGGIVKKLGNLSSCFCCGGRLMTGDVIESREHGVINGSCIVEEGSNNLLDTKNIICAEDGKLHFIIGILNSSSVGRRSPGKGRVLTPAIPKMLEFVEGLADIAWHGKVYDAILVVPFQCDANIFGARLHRLCTGL